METSPHDGYQYGGANSAVPDFSKRREILFFCQRITCFRCHGRFNFSGKPASKNIAGREIEFYCTGLYAAGSTHRANMLDASIATLEGVLDPMRRTAHDRFRLNCPSGSRSVPTTSADRRF